MFPMSLQAHGQVTDLEESTKEQLKTITAGTDMKHTDTCKVGASVPLHSNRYW